MPCRHATGVTFSVTDFGNTVMDCTVTETPVDEYTPGYTAGGDSNHVDDDPQSPGCHFFSVSLGDANSCQVSNTANDATFTVYMQWAIPNSGGAAVSEEVRVTAFCNNAIAGGVFDADKSVWWISDELGDGDSLIAMVDTSQQAAQCWAKQLITESGVEPSDDCGPRTIEAGGRSSCTITNTVFFEGIPALNSYGLAILTLLMLGLGVIGFRRFV